MQSLSDELKEKIKKKEAQIVVIGLGFVGLPTAVLFANAGFNVTGIDINPKIIEIVNEGKSPIEEPELDDLIRKVIENKKLVVSTKYDGTIENADVIIFVVQTPLGKNKKPDLTYLKNALTEASKYIKKQSLIIIESTTPPGTTHNIVIPIIEKISKLKNGVDFWVAYCPERIAPGKAVKEFIENNRLVGGTDETSTELAYSLLTQITKGKVIKTTALTAEISKVAENTFRDINIAYANELALLCEHLNADVISVIQCANTHPRVNIHLPGPGVGGPCLTKDPHFLITSVSMELPSDLIIPSRKINDYMPKHVVSLTEEALKNQDKKISDCKIAIFGLAYKGDVNDTRESPAIKIYELLSARGANLVIVDPFINEWQGISIYDDPINAVVNADVILIATDHSMFKKLDYSLLKTKMNEKPILVDGKRILSKQQIEELGFVYVGVGV